MADLLQHVSDQTERNRSVVERFFEAGQALDIEAVFALLDPEVTLHVPPGLPHSGTYAGVEGMAEAFAPIAERFDITQARCEARIADGDRVVMLIDLPMHDGRTSVQLAEVYRLTEEKIVEIRAFYWDTSVVK